MRISHYLFFPIFVYLPILYTCDLHDNAHAAYINISNTIQISFLLFARYTVAKKRRARWTLLDFFRPHFFPTRTKSTAIISEMTYRCYVEMKTRKQVGFSGQKLFIFIRGEKSENLISC